MKTIYEEGSTHRSQGDQEWYKYIWVREQPYWDWFKGRLVMAIDQVTWRPAPMRWIFAKIWDELDLWGEHLHKASGECNDDCGVWYRRLPSDPPESRGIEMDEAHAQPGCVYTPISVRWDLWVYDVEHRNQRTITRYIEDKNHARARKEE